MNDQQYNAVRNAANQGLYPGGVNVVRSGVQNGSCGCGGISGVYSARGVNSSNAFGSYGSALQQQIALANEAARRDTLVTNAGIRLRGETPFPISTNPLVSQAAQRAIFGGVDPSTVTFDNGFNGLNGVATNGVRNLNNGLSARALQAIYGTGFVPGDPSLQNTLYAENVLSANVDRNTFGLNGTRRRGATGGLEYYNGSTAQYYSPSRLQNISALG